MLKTEYLCPPKIDMLKPNALSNGISNGAFERCLGQEGGALKNGMCFYKRDPRELACSIYHVRLQQEIAIYEEVGPHQALNLLEP